MKLRWTKNYIILGLGDKLCKPVFWNINIYISQLSFCSIKSSSKTAGYLKRNFVFS